MDEKKRNYMIWSDQFETWMIMGSDVSTAEAVKHEAFAEMTFLEDGDEMVIRIKRKDITEAEMEAAPVM